MIQYRPGDFVACYLTNTEVFEELLTWGIVLQVSETLNDVLILDNMGNKNWYPSKRWRPLRERKQKLERSLVLAYEERY